MNQYRLHYNLQMNILLLFFFFFNTDQQNEGLFLWLTCVKCPRCFYRIYRSVTWLAPAQGGFLPDVLPQLVAYILLTKCKTNAHSDSEIKNIPLNLIPVSCISVCVSGSVLGRQELDILRPQVRSQRPSYCFGFPPKGLNR